MNKTVRYSLYILIITFCVAAIALGIYKQFYMTPKNELVQNGIIDPKTNETKDSGELKQVFDEMFTNNFYADANFDQSKVKKIKEEIPKLLTSQKITESEQGKYDISVVLPYFNIDTDVCKGYNAMTNNFYNYIENIKSESKSDNNVINANFVGYLREINEKYILSCALKVTIYSANKPQKTVINTYNYNITDDKDIKIKDILSLKNVEVKDITKQVNTAIQIQKNDENSSTNTFSRDVQSDLYKVENISTFLIGPNKELYLIFAYGNQDNIYTNTYDVVQIS